MAAARDADDRAIRGGAPACAILSMSRPVPFAHRGGAALWPENTAPAFTGCQELGPVVIETDVRATADGRLVLFHDSRLERTTNGHGRVADKSLRQLLSLDAGYWFTKDGSTFPYRGQRLRILTLDELFRALPDACYNLELKPGHPMAPLALWTFIESTGKHDRFLVASHDHAQLHAFRKHAAGRVATSASRREAMQFLALFRAELWGGLRPPYRALQLPVRAFGGDLITAPLLQAAHTLGLQVHAWTVNEAHEMQRLSALGVDGIMSDRPDLLMDVLSRHAR